MASDKNDTPNDIPHPRKATTLIGHGTIVDGFIEQIETRALRGRRAHHALIFTGIKGVGKATAAYALARRLFADTAPLVAAGSHPDLLTIELAAEKKTISVEQIRGISQFLHHRPAQGGWRMVIVDSLDAVNINGANAMLKSLEEPPAHAMIVLINHQGRPILPTIRSRAIPTPFKPLDTAATKDLIGQIFPEADAAWLDTAVRLADGAPGKAVLFAQAGVIDFYSEVCEALAADKPPLATLDNLASQLGAGGMANAPRRQAACWLFDRLLGRVLHRQASGLEAEDKATEALAGRLPLPKLAEMHQKLVADCDEAERLNLDQSVIFYNLMHHLAYGIRH